VGKSRKEGVNMRSDTSVSIIIATLVIAGVATDARAGELTMMIERDLAALG